MTGTASSRVVTVQARYEEVWRAMNDVALWPSILDDEVTVRLRRRTPHGDEYDVQTPAGGWVVSHQTDPGEHRVALRRGPLDDSTADPADAGAGAGGDELRLRSVAGGVEVRWERDGAGAGLTVPLARVAASLAAAEPAMPHTPLQAARALAPEVSAAATDAARAGTLPATLVARLRGAGLYGMGLPRALGGLQSDFRTIVTTIEELSRADAATGWHVLIGNTNAFLAWLAPTAAKELVGDRGSVSLAGSTAPAGAAQLVDPDRFRVSGRWPFCSGCLHADVLMVGFRMPKELARADRRPDARVGFFPAAAGTVLGTWRTMGLEATSSHDISLEELEIPAEHTAAIYYEQSREDGPLYRLTPYNILMVLLAGFPLGVARRAIDEATELSRTKTRVGSRTALIEDPAVLTALLDAESTLGAARAMVLDTLDQAWQTLSAGDELPAAHRARIAMTTGHALRRGREIATAMFRIGGASALRSDHPLQRCLRDLHVAGQHFGFSDDLRLRYGRVWFGLEPAPALYQV